MQALNIQILEPQKSNPQPKSFSSHKNDSKISMSFRDMVRSRTDEVKSEQMSKETSETKHVEKSAKPVETAKAKIVETVKAKAENTYVENEKVESQFNAEQVVPVYIPAEISSEKTIKTVEVASMVSDVSSEDIIINDTELSYLKTKAPSVDDPLAILENATEYASKDDLFINAQNLSVEDPEKFLDRLAVADENFVAADVNMAVLGMGQQVAVENKMDMPKEDSAVFTLEVADSGSEVKSEATSLFNEIFTVTDNRSVEEKVAQFKSMINEKSESAQENNINLALTMNENAAQNILASNNQSAGATGSTFQEMLTQQVQTNVPDFVKAGNIVLRDNNQGSINMILKPESLGNVKVNLQVTDNVITGQITVHSKEAFEAFKQNMDNLRQAFQDSGFDNANLNLSFADNGQSGAFAQGERQQSSEQFFGNQSYSNYAASSDNDDYGSASVAAYVNDGDAQVSIVA